MKQCNCKIKWDSEWDTDQFWFIEHCPMHKAAPKLLEACTDATALMLFMKKVELMKHHADDLRSDCNEGSITETEKQINVIIANIRAAIAAAEGSE